MNRKLFIVLVITLLLVGVNIFYYKLVPPPSGLRFCPSGSQNVMPGVGTSRDSSIKWTIFDGKRTREVKWDELDAKWVRKSCPLIPVSQIQ